MTFADRGKDKAQAVTENAKLILPTLLDITPHVLTIPMPGRYDPKRDNENISRIEQLIKLSDVVFMLTDSRESRWLPTLLVGAFGKIGISVALDYDNFLVTMHSTKHGCYFCPDPGAVPGDSMTRRPLDMQCTVARPGLSFMAAGLAVEMLTGHLLFPSDGKSDSCHARGFLSPNFSVKEYHTKGTPECFACGHDVMERYRREGTDFIESFLQNPSHFTFLNKPSTDEELETF